MNPHKMAPKSLRHETADVLTTLAKDSIACCIRLHSHGRSRNHEQISFEVSCFDGPHSM